MRLLLVGAGGHGRSVAAAASAAGYEIVAYADRKAAAWLNARRVGDDEADPGALDGFVMGLGGVTPDCLARRRALYRRYVERGFAPTVLIHPAAVVARGVVLEDGAMVLAGAVVNVGAAVGAAAIVNTGAIVEHDVRIGAGAHIGPGAIVLGQGRIGENAMVGAGAVVLPETEVPASAMVQALTRASVQVAGG